MVGKTIKRKKKGSWIDERGAATGVARVKGPRRWEALPAGASWFPALCWWCLRCKWAGASADGPCLEPVGPAATVAVRPTVITDNSRGHVGDTLQTKGTISTTYNYEWIMENRQHLIPADKSQSNVLPGHHTAYLLSSLVPCTNTTCRRQHPGQTAMSVTLALTVYLLVSASGCRTPCPGCTWEGAKKLVTAAACLVCFCRSLAARQSWQGVSCCARCRGR